MSSPKKQPFFEHRTFLAVCAVVTLVGGLWGLLGIPTPWQWFERSREAEALASKTEIVLDTSAPMGLAHGDSTRLDAAVSAVEDFVLPLHNEGLALRRTGSACSLPGELLVGFDRGAGSEVVDAAAGQVAEGPGNLTNAILAAIDDFADPELGGPNSRNRLLVVTSTGADACVSGGARGIRREIQRSRVEAVLALIVVGASPRTEERLRLLASALSPPAQAPPQGAAKAAETVAVAPAPSPICRYSAVECPGPEKGPPGATGPSESVHPVYSPAVPTFAPSKEFPEVVGSGSSSGGSSAGDERVGKLTVEIHFPRDDRELSKVIAAQRRAVLGEP